MSNATLSAIFGQMADVMEILGEDPFRVNSYRKVARVIGEMPTDVGVLLGNGQLADTPGIGKSTLVKIEEFVKTGVIKAHQELLARIPPSLLELLNIPGVGPKSVKTLYQDLHVGSIADLKRALDDGLVETLPGFGEKKAAAIRRGIEFLEKATGRIRLDQALAAADLVVAFLGELPGIDRIQPAGSLRRRAETIGDVDILVCSAAAWGERPARPRRSCGDARRYATGAGGVDRSLRESPFRGADSGGRRNERLGHHPDGYDAGPGRCAGGAAGELRGRGPVFHRLQGPQCPPARDRAKSQAQAQRVRPF